MRRVPGQDRAGSAHAWYRRLVHAFALGFLARNTFQVALYGGCLLALAFLCGFLVILATTQLGQNAGFLTGALEAAQGRIEIFVLFNTYTWH